MKNVLVCHLTCSHIKLCHFSVLLCIQVLCFSPLQISSITFLISLHITMCARKVVPFLIHIPGSGFSSLCTPRYHVSHLVSHQAVPFCIHIKVLHLSPLCTQGIRFLISCTHVLPLLHRKVSHLQSLSTSKSACGSSHLHPISCLSYTSRCCVSYLFPHQGIPFLF